ncbi:MAG TPA: HAD family hydrolase [Sphingobium sp.]
MTIDIAWDHYDLVVFDMDGTLYDQRRLRLGMARQLAGEVARTRSLVVLRLLSAYRRQREALGRMEAEDFQERQYHLPRHRPETVRALVGEWMEERPLALLPRCRLPGVERLFDALERRRAVALFSDYPVEAKLASLKLSASFSICAQEVGRLKPHPAGLLRLMELAGTSPARTLMIGDREDRDGAAARRAGVRALIRGRDFRNYDDRLFLHAA